MADKIIPLDPVLHDRPSFTCGNAMLDRYLHQQASQDIKAKVCTCFVLTQNNKRIKGYYTLSASSIGRNLLPKAAEKKLPRYTDLPVILLGRLAVDETEKGNGYGEILLIDALKRAYHASEKVAGAIAVVVDPIDEAAKNFYAKYGFIELSDSGKMFLPMKTIAELLA